MPFSRCDQIIERISDILDGEASLVIRARFHAHLAMCEHCTRYYEQLRATKEAASVVLPEDLPEDFASVMDFVLAEIEEGTPSEPPPSDPDT